MLIIDCTTNQMNELRKLFTQFIIYTHTVNIVDDSMKVIAKREFKLDPRGARCVCLWVCTCFCFGSFLTVESYDLCHQMTAKNEIYAGFYDDKIYEELEDEFESSIELRKHLMMLPVAVVLLALFLGKFSVDCRSMTMKVSRVSAKFRFIFISSFTIRKISFQGFLKGVLGCCSTRVGAWMFNYVQSSKYYRESSR